MRILSVGILLAIVCLSALASTQVKYFPVGVFDADPERDAHLAQWYSEDLKLLKEPSLLEPAVGPQKESYRFLWLRYSHPNFSIRLDVNDDGTSSVTTKSASDKHNGRSGKLKSSHVVQITKEQTALLLATIERNNFWKLPTFDSYRGLDGSEWIIEGTKRGTYHVVDRWTPKDEAVRAIGFAMLNGLANFKLDTTKSY